MLKKMGVLALAGCAVMPAIAVAGPTLSDVLDASNIAVNGHLSASYIYGTNKGQTLDYYYNAPPNSDTFYFNQAVLNVSDLPSSGIGGAVSLLAGADAGPVNGTYGNGASSDFALAQAYLQYAMGNFTIMGGRYYTLSGYETIDDSLDSEVTRSFIFTQAEPYVHTGIRTSYKFSNMLTGYLGINNAVYNGAIGNAVDDNKPKTIEVGFALAPTSSLAWSVYEYIGKEDPNGVGGASYMTSYLDTVLSLQATDALSFAVNGDWFREIGGSFGGGPTPGGAYIAGLALYANYQFNDAWKGVLRGEMLSTKNAVNCTKASGKCSLQEVTAALNYMPIKHLTVIGEVRANMGDKVYSNPNPAMTDSTQSLAIKAIYSF
jgi:hypothetical protein